MESGAPVDVRGLGPGQRFITAILKKRDNSIRPIRMVWNVEITEPGDVDGDGIVGFNDFITISRQFGNGVGRQNGDLDYSGEVGFADFMILSQNFGKASRGAVGSDFQTRSVPEPSTRVMGGLLMLLLMSARWRRVWRNNL